MSRIAIFPGSFDPITIGHEFIIRRSATLFDKLIVGIGKNSSKQSMFDIDKRLQWIKDSFINEPNITAIAYDGLTVNFCRAQNANYIVRGLRSFTDFEYESAIAQMNRKIAPEIETVFMLTAPEYDAIASNIVRDILRNGAMCNSFWQVELGFSY
ncbi:MAG: pantetheine-phosphate adenylyltransferase [Bacteroidetes bacterium]|nr:pantetheine-phosphate adenylyltransferase [Bacteroidota bacterium]